MLRPSAATSQPISIHAQAAGTVNNNPAISVTSSAPGIYEFDLSAAQKLLQANPNLSAQTLLDTASVQFNLSYNSANLDFPTTINFNQRAVVGNLVYFAADDGTGLSLWRTDGTVVGTVKVLNNAAAIPLTSTDQLMAVSSTGVTSNPADTLYFTSGNQVWKLSLGGAIASAANPAGSPVTITTSAAHYLSTGDVVDILGATGNTAVNGRWTVTVLSSTQFQLNGSSGNGTTISGGVWVKFTNTLSAAVVKTTTLSNVTNLGNLTYLGRQNDTDQVFFTGTDTGAVRLWLLDSSTAGAQKVIVEHNSAKLISKPSQFAVGVIGSTATLFFSADDPDSPARSGTVNSATSSNGFPITVTTSASHGMSTGDTVVISGNSVANGRWTVTVTAPNTFILNGSSGNGTTVSRGHVDASEGSPMVYPVDIRWRRLRANERRTNCRHHDRQSAEPQGDGEGGRLPPPAAACSSQQLPPARNRPSTPITARMLRR